MDKKELGKNIKSIRQQKLYSREYICKKVGISIHTLAKYEQGQREPNINMLDKLANALEVSRADLLGIENSFAKITKENQVKRREYTKTYTTDELKELEKDSFLIKCSEKEKALKLLTFLNLSEEIINSPLLEKSERKKFSELCGTIIDNWSNYMNENVYDSIINTSIELSKVNENN